MSLLQLCTHPGCATLTIGGLCIEHEPVLPARVFPRGRPFPPVPRGFERRSVASLRAREVTAATGAAT
jgi:hypothetical protein